MARAPRSASKVEREQRELECVLTPAESSVRADEMKVAELEIETLKTQRSVTTRAINTHATERNRLAHVLEAGRELRMVACTWTPDWQSAVKTLHRDDTGEVVATEPLTDAERQTGLVLVPDADPPPDPAPTTPRGKRGAIQHNHADPTTA